MAKGGRSFSKAIFAQSLQGTFVYCSFFPESVDLGP